MTLTKPIVLRIDTFDATIGTTVVFQVLGGDQIFHNEIEIYNNSTGLKVYSKKITTFNFEHEIPPNILTNTTLEEYYLRLRTYDVNNNFSVWSDNVYFKCLKKPSLTIPMLDSGKVNNQTLISQAVFASPQDPLKYYKAILYDEVKRIITSSPNLYDGLLQYEFTGFLDDTKYYLEYMAQTQNDVQVSTGLIPFVADFVAPRVKVLYNLYNDYNTASVKMDAKIIQMFWKSKNGTYTIEDGTLVNLLTDTIYLDSKEGFELDSSNFTLEMIVSNLKEDLPFSLSLAKYGELEFVYFKDRIHAYKKMNGITDRTRWIHYMTSESFSISETDTVFLYVRSVNNALEMRMEKLI